MNEHLAPIFRVVLPELDRSGSKYWVYGGVAIAGIEGEFLRPNPDVDLFVMEDNYEKVIEPLQGSIQSLGGDTKTTMQRKEKNETGSLQTKMKMFCQWSQCFLPEIESGLFLAVVVTHHRMYLLQRPERLLLSLWSHQVPH